MSIFFYIQGEHGTNLLYHLSCKHQDEYNTVKNLNQLNSSEVLNDENGVIQGLKIDKVGIRLSYRYKIMVAYF